MWPYMIRLNPVGVLALFLAAVCLYLLYSASSPATLRHFKDDPIGPRHPIEESSLFAETISLRKLLIAGIKAADAGGREVVAIRQSADIEARQKGLTREGAKEMVTKGDFRSHFVMVGALSATFTGLQIISEEKPDDQDLLDEEPIKPFHERDFISYSSDIKPLPMQISVPLSEITVWIDPLDATQEYSEDDPTLKKYVTTMVCIAHQGRPVMGIIHAPFDNITYWAWVGHGVSNSIKELHNRRDEVIKARAGKESVIISRSHSGDVGKYVKDQLGHDVDIVAAGGAGYKILQVIKGTADAYIHKTIIKKWDICAPNALIDEFGGKLTTLEGHSISYSYLDPAVLDGGVLAAATYTSHRDMLAKLKSRL